MVCRHGFRLLDDWTFDFRRCAADVEIEALLNWLAIAYPACVEHRPIPDTVPGCTYCAADRVAM